MSGSTLVRSARHAGLAALLVLCATSPAAAWPEYANESPTPVPNASAYKCLTCHLGQYGGYPTGHATYRLNPFGMHFGGYTNLTGHTDYAWDAALRNADSDGDGFTNQQELESYRLPGFDKSGASYAFTCYSAPSANYGETAGTYGNYVITYNASRLATPCGGNVGAYNNRPQFDLNDCTANIDLCDNSPAATCTNVVMPRSEGTSYTCTCPTYYTPNASQPPGSTCVDLNECMTQPNRCGVGLGTCMNQSPGFTCNCTAAGYVFDGTTCVVSNACVANIDDCNDPQATCTPDPVDPESEWTCGCNPGYVGSRCNLWALGPGGTAVCVQPAPFHCNDVNECSGVANCAARNACVNTPGSFTCTVCGTNTQVTGPSTNESCACLPGYGGDPTEGCEDIDECAEGTATCGANTVCTNTVGSYACPCRDGFVLDGGVCVDFDECASPKENDCSEQATCTNTEGAYTCACKPHFTGNGIVCADVNECLNGTAGCGEGELCTNVYGGPALCDCAPGYARVEGVCTTTCGNGLRITNEACDDGNVVDGDGCDAECAIEPGYACYEPTGGASVCTYTCGDGLIDPPAETCDDGELNDDVAPDGCRTSCRLAFCGDGVLDTGEVCDSGSEVSDTVADACRSTCVPAYCGDGVVDTGERCDPGDGSALDAALCQRGCNEGAGDGGCGCRVGGGATDEPPIGLALLALAAAWVARRRAR